MADTNLPNELILPIPENIKEQDLYKTIQDYVKEVNVSFTGLADVEAITAGDAITDTDNTFAVNVDDVTIEIATDALQVKGGGIDTTQLAADAVDGTKIADDAVDSEHIAAGAVDLEHMSANSVDSDQYVDGSIDTAHIGDNQVTADKIVDDLVFAQFPSTPSAAPDADYEVANKKYVDDNASSVSEYVNGTTHIEASADTERSTLLEAYTKLKEFSPVIRGGNVTIAWEHKTENGGGGNTTFYSKVYINGVAAGAEKSTGSSSYVAASESNLAVSAGDVIQIYGYLLSGDPQIGYVQNVKIKCENPTAIEEVSGY